MPDYVVYRRGDAEGHYDIMPTPPELAATGYKGDLAIVDTKNKVAYAVNASNLVRLMNGYNNIAGIRIK